MKFLHPMLLMGSTLLGSLVASAAASEAALAPVALPADARAMAAVTALVSCQPTTYTEAALAAELLQRAGTRAEDLPGAAQRFRLPAAVTVLGTPTDLIAVGGDGIHAILADTPIGNLTGTAALTPHHYPQRQGRWLTPVAVRNDGDGWIRQRVIEVDVDPQRPGDLRVACAEVIDSRRQQQERAGDVASMTYPAGTDVMPLVGNILECKADRRASVTLATSLLMNGPPSPPFATWGDESDAERFQWILPRPLPLRDVTVRSLRLVDSIAFGAVEDVPAAELARRWGLSSAENDFGEPVYLKDMPVRVAPDGWEEQRRLWVLDEEDGATLVGCGYEERVSEFGWWPGDRMDGTLVAPRR
jgi:hypothetical protein